MKVIDDLYFYCGKDPVKTLLGHGASSNVFAIDQGNEIWLIDAGVSILGRAKSIIRNMKRDGLNPKKISKILITHAHPDHMNAVKFFKKYSNAQVVVFKDGIERYKGGYKYNFKSQIECARKYHVLRKGVMIPTWLLFPIAVYIMGLKPKYESDIVALENDIITGNRYNLKVIHTPGHTAGHVCFYEQKKKWLFSGDVIDTVNENRPSMILLDSEYDQYEKTIEKLKDIEIEVLGAGHNTYVHLGIEQNREIIESWISKIIMAKERTIEILKIHNGKRGAKLKDFKGFLPKKVWNNSNQRCVPFAVIKSLIRQGKIEQKGMRFFYVD